MKEKTNNIMQYVMLLVGIFIIISVIINHNERIKYIDYKNYDKVIDSLNNIIKTDKQTYDSIISVYENKYDTIIIYKNKTVIKYENIEKSFSDNTVVSNDSITRYISSKLKDRK
jgi:hypothetical protein